MLFSDFLCMLFLLYLACFFCMFSYHTFFRMVFETPVACDKIDKDESGNICFSTIKWHGEEIKVGDCVYLNNDAFEFRVKPAPAPKPKGDTRNVRWLKLIEKDFILVL